MFPHKITIFQFEQEKYSLETFLIILLLCYRGGKSISNRTMMTVLVTLVILLAVVPIFLWGICFVSDWHTRLGHCSGMFKKNIINLEL